MLSISDRARIDLVSILKAMLFSEGVYFSTFQSLEDTQLDSLSISNSYQAICLIAPILATRLLQQKPEDPLINLVDLKQVLAKMIQADAEQFHSEYSQSEIEIAQMIIEQSYVYFVNSIPGNQVGPNSQYDFYWRKLEAALLVGNKYSLQPQDVFVNHFDEYLRAVFTRSQFEDCGSSILRQIHTPEFRALCHLTFRLIPEDERPNSSQIEKMISDHIRKLMVNIGSKFADETHRLYGRK